MAGPSHRPRPLAGESTSPAGVSTLAPGTSDARSQRKPWLFRIVPALDSLRHYSSRAFVADAIAGLTVAAVAVPQAMAYALVAGLPPQYGLYTAIVMTAVGALFDSSKQLINGPTNAISIAVLSALALVPEGERIGAAVLLAVLVGSGQTLIALMRVGDLTRYVSHSVIVGFTLGAGTLLVLDQLKNLLGLPGQGARSEHFLVRFWKTVTEGSAIDARAAAFGIGAIVAVVVLRYVSNRLYRMAGIRIPELLLTVMGAASIVWWFGLDQPGGGLRVVGEIPGQLPTFELPPLDWTLARELAPGALAIAVLGVLEAMAMAKAIAATTGQKLDMNQQCLSEGLANLTGGFFQCFPGSGSLTRSSINRLAGAVSQWSGVISAAAVAGTVVLFAPLARYIPVASLAGILMVAAYRMVEPKQLAYYLRATSFDARIVLATALSAVVISVEFCVLIGIFLSFFFYVPKAARVHLEELTITPERVIRAWRDTDERCSRLRLWDLEGELFFGAAQDLGAKLDHILEDAQDMGARIVVLRLKHARNPDAVCMRLFEDFVAKLTTTNIEVILCGVRRDLARILSNVGLMQRIGPERVHLEKAATWSSTFDAVQDAYRRLGDDRCSACPRSRQHPSGTRPSHYMI